MNGVLASIKGSRVVVAADESVFYFEDTRADKHCTSGPRDIFSDSTSCNSGKIISSPVGANSD